MLKQLLLVLAVSTSAIATTGPASGNWFYGLNYGLDHNACPTYDQIKSDFMKIKQYTNRLRTYSLSVCNEGALALQAANELDMNIYLGMWVDTPASFDAEIAALTSLVTNSGASLAKVDAIIVGSEVLYRQDTDAQFLANYIQKVGQIVRPKGMKVTTADVYYEFPTVVVEQLDFLMMNAFPFWEGVTAQEGANTLMNHYDSVVSGKALGKPVRISESGFPASGSFGASIGSEANQKIYLSNVLCVTRQRNIDLIWFSAIDEPYKGGVEANWGIMYSDRTLKSSLSTSLFQNPC